MWSPFTAPAKKKKKRGSLSVSRYKTSDPKAGGWGSLNLHTHTLRSARTDVARVLQTYLLQCQKENHLQPARGKPHKQSIHWMHFTHVNTDESKSLSRCIIWDPLKRDHPIVWGLEIKYSSGCHNLCPVACVKPQAAKYSRPSAFIRL